jgi:hypothetical protein
LAEMVRIQVQGQPRKIARAKVDWSCGSRSRVPALQARMNP